jgi:hypothetical protein
MLLVKVPRDGSMRRRTLLSFPPDANLLACDGAPDGSIYMDQAARQRSVLNVRTAGDIVSETPLTGDVDRVLPMPGGGFAFTLRRDGRSLLAAVRPSTEPQPLFDAVENAHLPGAWIGNDRLAFLIGKPDQVRLAIGVVESGKVLQRFPFDARHVTAIAAGPAGQKVYYTSVGALWEQPVAGGDPRKIGEGFDVATDRSGKFLYFKRHGAHGDELFRMSTADRNVEHISLPPGYRLAPNRLSAAAVNAAGKILVPVQKLGMTFFQAAIYDPASHNLSIVPAPFQTVVNGAGWAWDGSIELQITHWSSTVWRYRPAAKARQAGLLQRRVQFR